MDEHDFNIASSDDEGPSESNYRPPPEEILRLYTILDSGEIPELNWVSPGYRAPTPTNTPIVQETAEQEKEEINTDFDFKDEMSSPKMPVRREGETALKGSAKKKTTSLDGVLSNMRRHRRLELQMLDTPTTNNN